MNENIRALYLSVGEKKNTYIAFFLFLGIAALAFVANLFEITTPVIAQAILLISLMTAAYIFIRYIGTAYLYQIIAREDGDYLLVTRVQGKRRFTQCKLALSTLVALIPVQTTNAALRPMLPKCPSVNYSAHLLADNYTLLHFDDGRDPVLVRINADEDFLSHLFPYLSAASEAQSAEDPAEPENTPTEE